MWTLAFLTRLKPVVPYALRASIGSGMFTMHGLKKFYPDGAWDWARAWAASGGSPVLLYTVAWAELLAGLALMLGLMTRWGALVIIVGLSMYCGAKAWQGAPYSGIELGVAYIAGCIVLLSTGPGRWSLDRLLFGPEPARPLPDVPE